MSVCEDFKNEFSRQMVKCNNSDPQLFYNCRIKNFNLFLTVYRCFAAILSLIILIWSGVFANAPTILQFFTIWSYILIVSYFLTAAIVSLVHVCYARRGSNAVFTISQRQLQADFFESDASTSEAFRVSVPARQQMDRMPWYIQVQWCLYNISLPSSFVVTLIYWAVLYPLQPNDLGLVGGVLDLGLHAANTLLMVLEQYLSRIPTRLLHVYQPITYGVSYMIFSLILWAVNGTVIYPYVLDWNSPGISTGCLVAIIAFCCLTQFGLFLIYRALCKCCRSS